MAKIALISLGCAKNQVNLEEMRHLLEAAGHEIVPHAQGADVGVINTCGFIDAAKSEAIGHIMELGEIKATGKLQKIIITGCLSQRYGDEIFAELSEVDAVLGTGSYYEIASVVDRLLQGEQKIAIFGDIDAALETKARAITNSTGWTYLKIAEGCDNNCAYCVIPSLRGKFRSRPMEGLLDEARHLVEEHGVHELILVAQDITQYGRDLYGERRLSELIQKLAEIPGLTWIRLHYLYPDGIDDTLIASIRDTAQVVPYLDIPIQHISDKILAAMRRRGTGAEVRALIEKLRREIPNLVLRTSLITGLPGEEDAELEELANFLQEAKIERVGIFPYSPQEGTDAYDMPNRPTEEEAARNAELLLDIASQILDCFNQERIGQETQILCTGYDEERGLYYGRSYAESPDIDGLIWLETEETLTLGAFYRVRYEREQEGELVGEVMA